MNQEYRHCHTSVSKINYHLVFCPKYRKKLFSIAAFDLRFKALVEDICSRNNFLLLALETDKDYCHLFVNVAPSFSASDVVRIIKTNTSKILLSEFPWLRTSHGLWSRSYFASTAGDVSSEVIKRYIQNQRTR